MRRLLWAGLVLGLASCTLTHELPPPTAGPLDSVIRATPSLSTGKVKFNGPVTLQLGGTGNVATTTEVDKAKAPLATAPHAAASEATTRTNTPWYILAGLVVVGALAGAWVRGKFPFSL